MGCTRWSWSQNLLDSSHLRQKHNILYCISGYIINFSFRSHSWPRNLSAAGRVLVPWQRGKMICTGKRRTTIREKHSGWTSTAYTIRPHQIKGRLKGSAIWHSSGLVEAGLSSPSKVDNQVFEQVDHKWLGRGVQSSQVCCTCGVSWKMVVQLPVDFRGSCTRPKKRTEKEQ